MTSTVPTLSDEVMEALRPVMEAVGEQAREAARRAMQRRAERAGLAAVRALGYHSTHSDGHDAIMRAVFGDLRVSARNEVGMDRGHRLSPEEVNIDLIPEENLPEQVLVTPPAVPAPVPVGTEGEDDEEEAERLCECAQCYNETCQGDYCDRCEDSDCEQCHGDHGETYDCETCHDLRSCCNYCDKCDEHHDEADRNNYDYARCDDCSHCRECDHYCD